MPTWTFVRHGQSVANAEGWLAGHIDTPLTDLGRAQAERARDALAHRDFGRAVTSDLVRAKHTAQIILAAHPDLALVTTIELRERDCGQWRHRPIAELEPDREVNARLRGWRTRPPGGETLEAVALRAVAWLADHDDTDEAVLVVAHGALIRAVVGALDGLPHAEIGQWRPGNCEAIDRELPSGGWTTLLARLRAKSHG
jgi:probable phosphoglycerate mutase